MQTTFIYVSPILQSRKTRLNNNDFQRVRHYLWRRASDELNDYIMFIVQTALKFKNLRECSTMDEFAFIQPLKWKSKSSPV